MKLQQIGNRFRTDPVPQLAEINERTLDRWVEEGKAWHVDNCGRNAKALHSMMRLLPKENSDPYFGWKSKVALFPRSEQYEYWYIRNSRINDAKQSLIEEDKSSAAGGCDDKRMPDSRGANLSVLDRGEPPLDGTPSFLVQSSVGDLDDYGYRRPDAEEALAPLGNSRYSQNSTVVAKIPGIINVQEQSRDCNGNEEMREKNGDRIETQICRPGEGEGEPFKDAVDAEKPEKCECSRYNAPHKSSAYRSGVIVDDEGKEDALKNDCRKQLRNVEKFDRRWNPRREKDEEERRRGMSNVLRPYRHEISTWYSVNKPTEVQPSAGCFLAGGKRSKPEWHFSNL